MRIKFIKKTKDIREGREKYYRGIPKRGENHTQSIVAIDRKLGEVYVKAGDAIEVDRENNEIVKKKKSEKVEKDGKV